MLEYFFGRLLGEGNVLPQIVLGLSATLVTLFFVLSVKRLRTEGLFDFFFTPVTDRDASPFKLLSLIISAVGGAIGGGVILAADHVSSETILLAFVIFFGAIVLASVPDAISINPPLPEVEVVVKTEKGERTRHGKLIAHSENHWYIFDYDEEVLHIIPDAHAEVTVH